MLNWGSSGYIRRFHFIISPFCLYYASVKQQHGDNGTIKFRVLSSTDEILWVIKTPSQKSIYLSIYLSSCWSTVILLDLGHFFSFLILYTVGTTPWTGDQPVARHLPTYRTTQTQNKRKQTPLPWVGFEPTIPAFERAKPVHALDCAATVIGPSEKYYNKIVRSADGSKFVFRKTRHTKFSKIKNTFEEPQSRLLRKKFHC
jgi:hypothetical protein